MPKKWSKEAVVDIETLGRPYCDFLGLARALERGLTYDIRPLTSLKV